METIRLAIPSAAPGGLDCELGAHFGHCDCYTVVDVADGRVAELLRTVCGVLHCPLPACLQTGN